MVFGSFIGGERPHRQLFGIGLASAVLLDATIVRMLLVPADGASRRRQLVAPTVARPFAAAGGRRGPPLEVRPPELETV